MGIVFSRSKKKSIPQTSKPASASPIPDNTSDKIIELKTETELELHPDTQIPDNIESVEVIELKTETEPEPHPDTPIPVLEEAKTDSKTELTILETVDEQQERESKQEYEAETNPEVVLTDLEVKPTLGSQSKINKVEEKEVVTEIEPIEDNDVDSNAEEDIEQSENYVPYLRLTPITAKTVVKNFSTPLNAIWRWGTNSEELIWNVNFAKTGDVEISLDLHDIQIEKPFTFTVSICDEQLECACDVNDNYPTFPLNSSEEESITRLPAGVINISEPGAKTVLVKVNEMHGEHVGNLCLLDLKGPAVEKAVIESQNANTVSALWGVKDCEFFYTAIEIVESCPGTFFGVCCFNVLQMGLYDCQGHRSIWFRINQLPEAEQEQSIEVIEVGEDVKLTDREMKNLKTIEGVFQFSWTFDTAYHMMVKMQEVDNHFQYSVYFYKEDEETWKQIVIFKRISSNESESAFGCLIEDKRMGTIKSLRRAKFGPCWYWKENDWHPVDTVLPQLVGHVVNTNLYVEEDKVCLLIGPDPVYQNDVHSTKELNIVNSVPSVLESFPQ